MAAESIKYQCYFVLACVGIYMKLSHFCHIINESCDKMMLKHHISFKLRPYGNKLVYQIQLTPRLTVCVLGFPQVVR